MSDERAEVAELANPEIQDMTDSPDDPQDVAQDLSDADDVPADDALQNDGSASVRVTAHGVLTRDQRRVDDTRTHLLPVETVPIAGLTVSVRADGETLASGPTDAAGGFAFELEYPVGATLDVVWTTSDSEARLAVLDSEGVGVPPRAGIPVRASRVWAWVAAPIAEGDFGTLHISEAQGAGAIAIYQEAEALRARMRLLFLRELPTLAILWNPLRTPPCLSCYLPTGWGPAILRTSGSETTFERAIFLSGAASAPHHFTPSLVLHELGHWVMDGYSTFPAVSGGHGWGERLAPPLAWSEGFATFFAQWAQSEAALDSRFFTVQANIQYWVDIEAIGAPDDTSLGVAFPLPSAGGGMTQAINEAVVAGILWDIWDPTNDETVALGDVVLTAIARIGDRGVAGPDLVDALDAIACAVDVRGGAGLPAELGDWASALLGFPWDATPACR